MIRSLALAAGAALTAAAAPAATLDRFDHVVVIGDSLSDPGNLFALTGFPPPPYAAGRFSNGPVWAELLGVPVTNLAQGGAATVSVPGLPDDLPEQLAAVPALPVGETRLTAIWLGSNDVFGAFNAGLDPSLAAAAAAVTIGDAALGLLQPGAEDFLLFTLPDFGLIPQFAGTPAAAAATAASDAFNAAFSGQVTRLETAGARVSVVDIAALFDAAIADPASLGLAPDLGACLTATSVCADPDAQFFFDAVHPNAVVQAEIANAALAALTPVPLPAGWALLATAVLIGGVLAARRAA